MSLAWYVARIEAKVAATERQKGYLGKKERCLEKKGEEKDGEIMNKPIERMSSNSKHFWRLEKTDVMWICREFVVKSEPIIFYSL